MEDVDAGKNICFLVEKKLILFKRYLALTKGMKETISHKEPSNLLESLSKRGDCIAEIEKVDLSLAKVMKERGHEIPHIPDELKGTNEGYFKDLKDVMEAVDIIEKELMTLVREEGESIKMALFKSQTVMKAAIGYKRLGKSSPRFLDTVR